MKRSPLVAAVLAIAASAHAFGAPAEKPAPDDVLLENGPAKVTVRDFDAAMTRFPENLRDEARAYPSVIMRNLDALFVNRVAAQKAVEAGLDKDPLVRQRMKKFGSRPRYAARIGRETQKEAAVLCRSIRAAGGACIVLRN